MDRIRFLFKKALTPITIMVIPHENLKSLNLKVPLVGLLLSLLVLTVGAVQSYRLFVNGLKYTFLMYKVDFYNQKFSEWKSTVTALKETERDFRKIFSLKSKDEVLDTVDTSYSGDIDIENLMGEIQKTVERVDEIKDYLRIQKDIYMATPKGYPAEGNISSPYGMRYNPFGAERIFHSGVDISATPGTPIRATADGVVSYSGWTQFSGYVVVIQHGCGFSTAYAHNRGNAVKVGQRVKRGETVGYIGSSGKSTGPHVHYEVWEKGKRIDPSKFLQGRS
ncbi:MAG TPA: M23 family metallopeptidase [Thermodesulfobacteriota bacterium]|nr:M23 family metallopeptidase [Thermodesulfobacteriota bacterium]